MNKEKLYKKALLLSYFTVGYNVVEGIIAIALGFFTGSVALMGFGFDSFIESLSGGVMVWRFSSHVLTDAEEEVIERKAQKLIAVAFFVLGIYVLIESIKDLMLQEPSEPSLFGIGVAFVSLMIMPALIYLKTKVSKELNSKSLSSDSKQALICMMMSAALLISLGLNYLFGLWWIDPITGLFFVVVLWKEGYESFKGEAHG